MRRSAFALVLALLGIGIGSASCGTKAPAPRPVVGAAAPGGPPVAAPPRTPGAVIGEYVAAWDQVTGVVRVEARLTAAAGSVLAYSFVLTLIIAYVLKVTIGLRVTDEEEVTGVDQTVHAETAYEFGSALAGSGAGGLVSPQSDLASSARVSS